MWQSENIHKKSINVISRKVKHKQGFEPKSEPSKIHYPVNSQLM